MGKVESNATKTIFEQIRREDKNGNEYWTARDLSKILEYQEYRNFKPVIQKAKEACRNSDHAESDHFVDMHDMVSLGLGAKRNVENVKLSRYACYLIVQNADPSKEIVAIGQTYFAVQTRLQEIRQMSEYQELRTEDERRLFLRNELRNHNFQLAEAAQKSDYIKLKGIDDNYCQTIILDYLHKFGKGSRSDFVKILLDKLSDRLDENQKINKIKNTLQKLKSRGNIRLESGKLWVLSK
ncbi:MAG: hypothetical protein KKD38_03755 [Candidatus Delongbacteria bacterium]|nr:hypothetical protein [Candidatus Delongbacteria bacterium]